MSLIKQLALLGLLALAGCGWHSVYGTMGDNGDKVAANLNNIAIANIADRNGQMLRNDLMDRLYGKERPEHPRYTLTVKLTYSTEDLGILANATATRSLMNMQADYIMTGPDGKDVLRGAAHSVASFDRLDQMYATVASQDDAYNRTIHEVSEQIVNRLSLYFSERQ
ncbi:MAG: LPS assembly lipoprotein LptE [Alphaproteobacteria bacterium]|nr:LPS assembly lipoprotein LptE [Alphaproteobacteria bacterium]